MNAGEDTPAGQQAAKGEQTVSSLQAIRVLGKNAFPTGQNSPARAVRLTKMQVTHADDHHHRTTYESDNLLEEPPDSAAAIPETGDVTAAVLAVELAEPPTTATVELALHKKPKIHPVTAVTLVSAWLAQCPIYFGDFFSFAVALTLALTASTSLAADDDDDDDDDIDGDRVDTTCFDAQATGPLRAALPEYQLSVGRTNPCFCFHGHKCNRSSTLFTARWGKPCGRKESRQASRRNSLPSAPRSLAITSVISSAANGSCNSIRWRKSPPPLKAAWATSFAIYEPRSRNELWLPPFLKNLTTPGPGIHSNKSPETPPSPSSGPAGWARRSTVSARSFSIARPNTWHARIRAREAAAAGTT